MWLTKSLEEKGFNFHPLLLFTFLSSEKGLGPNQIHRAIYRQPRRNQIRVQIFSLAEGQIRAICQWERFAWTSCILIHQPDILRCKCGNR